MEWPSFEHEAHSGAQALLDWIGFECDAAAANPGFGVALIELSDFEYEMTAFTGLVANANFILQDFNLEGYSGTSSLLDWPVFYVNGLAISGATASALLDWPMIEYTATAIVYGSANILLDWPDFLIEAGDGVHVLFDLSPFTAVATATHIAASEETYAINLSTGAVTKLILGGMDKLVAAYGKLYVLRNGELLVLSGDSDEVDTQIPVTVRFAQQNFGVFNSKRCFAIYLNARESNGVILDLVEDERKTWRYQTPTDTAPAMGTHRIKTGRGIKFHTLGLVIQNINGDNLNIGGIELFIQQLSSRPKT